MSVSIILAKPVMFVLAQSFISTSDAKSFSKDLCRINILKTTIETNIHGNSSIVDKPNFPKRGLHLSVSTLQSPCNFCPAHILNCKVNRIQACDV